MIMATPVHPGEILREDVLADLGLTVGEAASRLGVSRVTLSRVLHGHARISPNLAIRLEQAGVSTARAWLAMQSAYDLAVERAGDRAAGSVAASDAFFPFADGPQVLIDAGIRTIVQPGGSVRDQEVIDAARTAGVTMFFTGERHFFH